MFVLKKTLKKSQKDKIKANKINKMNKEAYKV